MDELELLKKDWRKKDLEHPKLSYEEIYGMLWKKSSSIVKWLFLISILEFVLPHLLYLLPSSRTDLHLFGSTGFENYFIVFTIFYYAVVLYFIFQFYKRYKEISTLDNAKNLMKKIIKTRKTVKNYIIFSLSMILMTIVLFMLGIYLNDDFSDLALDLGEKAKNLSQEKLKSTLIIGIGILGIVMTALIGAVYFLIYGLLIKKLKGNYTELQKLEV